MMLPRLPERIDHYALLGVPEDASAADCRQAFHRQLAALAARPPWRRLLDRLCGRSAAAYARACRELCDPIARARYDAWRRGVLQHWMGLPC